ncbi:leucine-rich repeat domain-containing protein [Promethearchaeum syntrophicum]|uniref:Leucine-rich repeat domain-containing protein n=1 Tax=Promethearchaeum syntrophicum TaxID=2594042 RepID=A0A5B9DAG0_9ARCH|nr:leucine-rich repeat domain-containing protein [Candidatus Prometheoarchaeum syntrophicum]QEE15827.1 Leucine Rich repeats (2 copies) [Candidatus Prometheoarchaeum syntrophicum]
MISDSEKAVFKAFKKKYPELKIYRKKKWELRKWVEISPRPRYYVKNGQIIKLRITGIKNLISLPENIGNLVYLQELDLGWNQLLNLPESFGNLVKVRKLQLWGNKLTSLPESFRNLVNLQHLDLTDNPIVSLSNIPLELLKIAHIPTDNLLSKGQSLFFSENYGDLFRYYQKSPIKLVQQYIKDPQSLTFDEKERLSYEAGHLEKKILETKVHPDDLILNQITERLAIELYNGLKLHL